MLLHFQVESVGRAQGLYLAPQKSDSCLCSAARAWIGSEGSQQELFPIPAQLPLLRWDHQLWGASGDVCWSVLEWVPALLASPWSSQRPFPALPTLESSRGWERGGRNLWDLRNEQGQLSLLHLWGSKRFHLSLVVVGSGSCCSLFVPLWREQEGTLLTPLYFCVLCLVLSWKEVTSSQKNGERGLQTQGTVQQLNAAFWAGYLEVCIMEIGRLANFLYRISIANTQSLSANSYTGLFRSCFLTEEWLWVHVPWYSIQGCIQDKFWLWEEHKPSFVLHIPIVHVRGSGKTLILLAIGAHRLTFPLRKRPKWVCFNLNWKFI